MSAFWRTVGVLAAGQYGLVAWPQLEELRVPRHALNRLLGAGWLERLHHTVYRVVAAPRSWEQSMLAAVLAAPGSAASHRAAALLWQLDGVRGRLVEITAPRGHVPQGLRNAIVHQTRRTLPTTAIRGIPTTTAVRTIVDLADVVPRGVLLLALDDALRRNLLTLDELERACIPGRRGVEPLRTAIREQRGLPILGSDLERQFHEALRDVGLPELTRQHQVTHRGRVLAEIDFSYPNLKISVELDGGGHLKLRQRQKDSARQNQLELRGWLILRYWRRDLEERFSECIEEIRLAYVTRSADQAR